MGSFKITNKQKQQTEVGMYLHSSLSLLCQAGHFNEVCPALYKYHTPPHPLHHISEGVSTHPRLELWMFPEAIPGQRFGLADTAISHDVVFHTKRKKMGKVREKVRLNCSNSLGHRLMSLQSVPQTSSTLPRKAEQLQQEGWGLNGDWR